MMKVKKLFCHLKKKFVVFLFDLDNQRIGPCSVAALKSGTLDLKWDTPGMYNVLNGNRNYWVVYPNGNKRFICTNKIFVFNIIYFLFSSFR